mgnify:FL=1
MSDNAVFIEALAKLNEKITGKEVNPKTIMTILRFAMEVVEATKLKGTEQKTLATKLVRQVVVDAPITDDKEKLLLDMIDEDILGDTIELIVLASQGELDINSIVEVATGCCAAFIKSKKK